MRLLPAALLITAVLVLESLVLESLVQPAGAAAPPVGTTSVFAAVPLPGHADTTIVAPDGSVVVSTNRGARGSAGPSVPAGRGR